jgi:phospholipase C
VLDGDIHNIEHVIIIMQENRSFDEYFGTYPGADGIPDGVTVPDPATGQNVAPYHTHMDRNQGASHSQQAARTDIDNPASRRTTSWCPVGVRCVPIPWTRSPEGPIWRTTPRQMMIPSGSDGRT